jgi:hypothetical protein
MKTSTRDDVKQLAVAIEALAKEVQNRIDAGSDVLAIANELVRNNLTLVFALGEVSAVDNMQSVTVVKKVTVKTVKPGKVRNYTNNHKARNTVTGRFVKA